MYLNVLRTYTQALLDSFSESPSQKETITSHNVFTHNGLETTIRKLHVALNSKQTAMTTT